MKRQTTGGTEDDVDPGMPRSPARSLGILQLLARQPAGQTLSELSVALEAPKTSVLSLLRALHQTGYVKLDGMRYQLGDEARVLGTLIAAQTRFPEVSQLPQIAQPFLRLLAERSGETVFVSCLTDDQLEAVYVARAESNHPIRFMASIGERRPLYSSAGGRALLAFMPAADQAHYIKRLKPVAFTKKTVVDKRAIRDMLVEIRRTGFSMTCDDTHLGVAAFATPIYAHGGHVVAALVIAAPTERLQPKGEQLKRLLGECAATLSLAMGGQAGDA
ncbi:MAG: IclR family transcriptional regulator [Pseudomonadota bacterium]